MEEVSLHQKNTISKMNLEEMLALNSFLVGRIKAKRAVEAKRMKRLLFVGSKVSFEDNDGFTVQGKIIKVMRKFAQVDIGPVIYRVPLNRLTKVAS